MVLTFIKGEIEDSISLCDDIQNAYYVKQINWVIIFSCLNRSKIILDIKCLIDRYLSLNICWNKFEIGLLKFNVFIR